MVERITNDPEHEIMKTIKGSEIVNEIHKQNTEVKKLLHERRSVIKKAYLSLPDPANYHDGDVYKVVCPPNGNRLLKIVNSEDDLEIFEKYEFVLVNGKWGMTETEYNFHLFKGFYK